MVTYGYVRYTRHTNMYIRVIACVIDETRAVLNIYVCFLHLNCTSICRYSYKCPKHLNTQTTSLKQRICVNRTEGAREQHNVSGESDLREKVNLRLATSILYLNIYYLNLCNLLVLY